MENAPDQQLDERRARFFKRNIKDEGSLQKSGNRFIMKCLEIYEEHITDELKTVIHGYMVEVLHSIFFLGNIHKNKIMPTDFFAEKEFSQLYNKFSKPFNEFCTHLPTRTPFSILLDVVVKIKGSQNEIEVMEYLLTLLKQLNVPKKPYFNYYTLEATVICICHYEMTGEKQRTSSMEPPCPARGLESSRSSFPSRDRHTWTLKVAYAVALADEGGAIQLPQTVKCKAFKRIREMTAIVKNLHAKIALLYSKELRSSLVTVKPMKNQSGPMATVLKQSLSANSSMQIQHSVNKYKF
ncbi:uncharacterized protein LOC127631422 [Xyrauchen texanus]|uniref:uncharacterized protein LOC127631422 n=1 Tax=Xyrauchen texanus TaxID=154827 RepID=UPI002242B512|nr:uncharacterized protein LOC127631422 [Xyrauchen texanus]